MERLYQRAKKRRRKKIHWLDKLVDMETIGAFEAKTHLGELLDRVETGESIAITRHGKLVAQLVPAAIGSKRERSEVVREMLEFGKGRRLGKSSIKEMINQGRRF
jgi:prevent-host-death family protein